MAAPIVEPDADPLRGTEGKRACDDLLKTYTRVIRSADDPPVAGQECVLVSVNLFDPPKKTTAGSPLYGFFKVRGVGSDSMLRMQACKIIKEVDSVHAIKLLHMGRWHALTTDQRFDKETVEVHTQEEEDRFQTQAREDVQKKLKQQRDDLKRRADAIMTETDPREDTASLEHYTAKRSSEITISNEIAATLEKLEELRVVSRRQHKEIVELERANPQYRDAWMQEFNAKRKSAHVNMFVPSSDQFKALDEYRHSLTLVLPDGRNRVSEFAQQLAATTLQNT